ncbi:MAG: HNH endonuclease [Fusobacteriaceae bacterium]
MKIQHLNTVYGEKLNDYILREDGTIWRYKKPLEGKYTKVKIRYMDKMYDFDSESIPDHIKFDGAWWRIIKLGMSYQGTGYKQAIIRGKNVQIHRALALCFIPNPDNKPIVDHINIDSMDNRLENLRWVTISENAKNVKSFRPENLGKALNKANIYVLTDINGVVVDKGTAKELIEKREDILDRTYLHRNIGKFAPKIQCYVNVTFND